MAETLGYMLPAAVAALALSLPEVVVMILLLEPDKSRTNAYGFASGLLLSYLAISGAFLLLAGAFDLGRTEQRSNWVAILLFLLAAALMFVGIRRLFSRAGAEDSEQQSAISKTIANLSPVKAVSLGTVMGGLNPAFMVLIGSLIAELTLTDANRTEQAVALLIFALIGSAGVLGPLVAIGIAEQRAQTGLRIVNERLNAWMGPIMTLMLFYFGIKLIGDALRTLTWRNYPNELSASARVMSPLSPWERGRG